MYQLTNSQKISNLDEMLALKKAKLSRLEEEIRCLEAKKARLLSKESGNTDTYPSLRGLANYSGI